ncbi:lysophospholipid acyltransferase family protein [Herpetosiphon sp. NSE202]|uniref:lysophospholipid acyltransferase family protein n=1 Tax=Herpetosiphon sp. NSE202 TaxID=3351349 RepID=UPI003634F167
MNTLKLYRLAMRWLPRFPNWLVYAACDVCALLALFSPKLRRNTSSNLARVAPKTKGIARLYMQSRVVANVLRHYADLVRLPAWSLEHMRQRFDYSGLEHLQALAETGGLLVVAHTGAFSTGLSVLAAHGLPVVLVVEAIEPPEFLQLVKELREAHGGELIVLGPNAGREVLKALRAKKIVVLAGDRDLASQAIKIPFFGELADVPIGPARLALRGWPVALGSCAWFGANEPFFRVDPIRHFQALPDENTDQAAERVAREMLSYLETWIVKWPESWGVLQPVWPERTND